MNRDHQPALKTLAADTEQANPAVNSYQGSGKIPRLLSHNPNADASFDTVALVLAGGRGTRLHPLTQRRCKPAVPFGGNFRIIDFTLSNCINSGVRRVGVVTQYKQHSLIKHIQEGWNFIQRHHNEFIDIMPAQQRHGGNWYQGTADAVTQNQEFLKHLSPRHTLILAGDHIYKADYRRMIKQHVTSRADVTIACCEVPVEKARHFGIVKTNEQRRIIDFQEKPEDASSMRGAIGKAQASMGIYLFNTDLLLECLAKDSHDPKSQHDFGNDIIPALIDAHHVEAYGFEQSQAEGYWRDVGTLDAYYEANMQLLDPKPSIELNNRDWPIHTRLKNTFPTHFTADSLGHRGLATDCIVGCGCVLRGSRVRHSILFTDVQIDEQSQVDDSLILPGAMIGKRCRIRNAIIDSRVRIEDGTEIGYDRYSDALRYNISRNGTVIVTDNDIDATQVSIKMIESNSAENVCNVRQFSYVSDLPCQSE